MHVHWTLITHPHSYALHICPYRFPMGWILNSGSEKIKSRLYIEKIDNIYIYINIFNIYTYNVSCKTRNCTTQWMDPAVTAHGKRNRCPLMVTMAMFHHLAIVRGSHSLTPFSRLARNWPWCRRLYLWTRWWDLVDMDNLEKKNRNHIKIGIFQYILKV